MLALVGVRKATIEMNVRGLEAITEGWPVALGTGRCGSSRSRARLSFEPSCYFYLVRIALV